jgi:hypothetical protein
VEQNLGSRNCPRVTQSSLIVPYQIHGFKQKLSV